jgi:hypothetical protein
VESSTVGTGDVMSVVDLPLMSGGGMMGGGMMQGGMMPGMMTGGQSDPRAMQMRGEMMNAMGDIMMKYGKMMEGAGR